MTERDLAALNVVEVAPFRVAHWEATADGRAVLIRPRPRRGPGAVRRWERYLLGARRIRLDEVGTAVWELLDGRRTVGDVAAAIRARFGGRAEPAEERVGHLIRILRREGLAGYRGVDHPLTTTTHR